MDEQPSPRKIKKKMVFSLSGCTETLNVWGNRCAAGGFDVQVNMYKETQKKHPLQ